MSASPESQVISRGGLYEPRMTTRRRCRTRKTTRKLAPKWCSPRTRRPDVVLLMKRTLSYAWSGVGA